MSLTLNRAAFERLLNEDLEWLRTQPDTLERWHIESIINERLKSAPASANLEEIAREAAQEIADSNSQTQEPILEYHAILSAIQSALAPVQAELEQAKEINNAAHDQLAVAYEQNADLQSRLTQAEEELAQAKGREAAMDRLHQARMEETAEASRDMARKLEKAEAALEWLRKQSEQDDEDAQLFHLKFDWSLREWDSFLAAIAAQAKP